MKTFEEFQVAGRELYHGLSTSGLDGINEYGAPVVFTLTAQDKKIAAAPWTDLSGGPEYEIKWFVEGLALALKMQHNQEIDATFSHEVQVLTSAVATIGLKHNAEVTMNAAVNAIPDSLGGLYREFEYWKFKPAIYAEREARTEENRLYSAYRGLSIVAARQRVQV